MNKKQLLALMTVCLATASCGGGGSSSTTTTPTQEITYLNDYMREWYLWYRDMPNPNLTNFASVEKALSGLVVSQDRFSNITSAAEADAFFDEGSLIAFGVSYDIGASTLAIKQIQPNSPAQLAGMLRGDAISAIDGTSVPELITANSVSDAFGAIEVGVMRTLTVIRGTQTLNFKLTKAQFSLVNVPIAKTFNVANRVVGYAVFNQFTTPSLSEWRSELGKLKQQGASEIIVDLRFNGGGLVTISAAASAALIPATGAGKTFAQLNFNDKNTARNTNTPFPIEALAGSFSSVTFLTSARTCSAAEEMIVGVLPYVAANKVKIIGEKTCGKPVGFTAPTFNGKKYNIVTFRSSNSAGKTDYFDGLKPDCAALDDFSKPLGDVNESQLAAALAYLEKGTCSAVAATQLQGKAFSSQSAATIPVNGLVRQTDIY